VVRHHCLQGPKAEVNPILIGLAIVSKALSIATSTTPLILIFEISRQ
jgi:hypothetical protein